MKRRTLLRASLGLGLGAAAGIAWLGRNGLDLPANPLPAGLSPRARSGRVFGANVTLRALHATPSVADAALDDAFNRMAAVDALMSLYREDSQLSLLNRDGVLATPDRRLVEVLGVAQDLAQRTGGAFDVTVQPLWLAFADAQGRGSLPQPDEIAAAKGRVGWQRLEVTPERVRLGAPGMAITLNGLAQGYGADVAVAALREHGIEHALLDTGEFATIGAKEAGAPWVLGVRHPRDAAAIAARVAMDGRRLATSGDYETVFSPDFVHNHIFDPAVGDSPVELASVSVLAPTGILADGLSTAFMVMGAERSLALAAQLDRVDALLIAKDGRRWQTAGFPALPA